MCHLVKLETFVNLCEEIIQILLGVQCKCVTRIEVKMTWSKPNQSTKRMHISSIYCIPIRVLCWITYTFIIPMAFVARTNSDKTIYFTLRNLNANKQIIALDLSPNRVCSKTVAIMATIVSSFNDGIPIKDIDKLGVCQCYGTARIQKRVHTYLETLYILIRNYKVSWTNEWLQVISTGDSH